jgi:hypothetical protein
MLAIVVAIVTTIAFTVHCDDTPFKSFARSLVKQPISLSGPISKIKTDLSTCILVNTSTILNYDIISFRCKSVTLIEIPALIFAKSVPPYRGPPTSIPL